MPILKKIEYIENVSEKDVSVNEYISFKVRERRIKKGYTQEDFAKMIGLNRTTLSNIEACRQKVTAELLFKICEQLKCKVQDIFPNP